MQPSGSSVRSDGRSVANMGLRICVVSILICWMRVSSAATNKLCFSKDFMFGVSTASYQIEGAWNSSGKGEGMWDRYTHSHPERIADHSNGDVTTDSYHKYMADIRLLRELGVGFYRFSISWPRILPTGLTNEINEEGLNYYKTLLDELHYNGIEPLVTMYHWDLPQPLQDLGGWTNPMIADYFVDYARVLLEHLGHRVRFWLTFNEPLTFCRDGYGGDDAPGDRATGLEDYMCGHTVLRAHGATYRMFKKEYRRQRSFMGLSLDLSWVEPATTSKEDVEIAEITRQFFFGWFAHPILSKEGNYPAVMREHVDNNSRRQHFSRSRLPHLTPQEVYAIRGAYDFIGVNHYTTYLASKNKRKISAIPSFMDDIGVELSQKEEWPKSNSTWLKVVPWGFRKTLNWIKNTYGNPPVLITENGFCLEPGLHDTRRINYIDGYLRALHSAITIDGCNVYGYTYWTLMDNFEWTYGYSQRYGLYEVDFKSPERTRTARLSAAYYNHVATTKCIPDKDSTFYY